MGDSITGATRDSGDYETDPATKGDAAGPEVRSARSSSDSSNEGGQNEHDPSRPAMFSEKEEGAGTERSLLSRLAIPLALVVGCAITGGTTYALVARVQHLIANATVDGDTSKWVHTARTTAYDACYYGCNDCSDPSFAYNACQLTARAHVKGVICAGEDMWNWAPADRYPPACLMAVAQLLMGEELERLKQSYRNQLAIITLTVLGGVVGGVITYLLWRRLTTTKAQREAAKAKKASKSETEEPKRKWSRPGTWKRTKTHHQHATEPERSGSPPRRSSSSSSSRRPSSRRSSASSASSRRSQTRLGSLATASLTMLATTNSGASAYPCTGRDPAWNQFFVSPNGTVAGILHGWLSECNDRQDCRQKCSTSCSTSSSGARSCSKKCTNSDCHTVVETTRTPKQAVDAIVPHVQACGFALVDALSGSVSVTERVGNARLERDWWVRVSVNGLNVTREDETDDMVWCLHAIGDMYTR